MKKTLIVFTLATIALSASAKLTVEESADGVFVIKRNGTPVLTEITPSGKGLDQVEKCFTQVNGAAVWNRWNTNAHIRCEVVQRTDGAIELTVLGQSATLDERSSRGLKFRMPAAVTDGKPWKGKVCDRRSGSVGEGTFGKAFKPFSARYLAVDGLALNLDAIGPGEYGGGHYGINGTVDIKPDGAGGALFSAVGWSSGNDVRPIGAKLIIHEGTFDDYWRDHFLYSYPLYWTTLRPKHLVKFGSLKAGKANDGDVERYADGNRPFANGYGWLDGLKPETKVGYPNGAYYSHACGKGQATYRFANLHRGYYILTLQAGNWSGTANDFSVTVNGEKLRDGIAIPARKARTIARAFFVADGKLDVAFDGNWLVSGIGLQPLLSEQEDFSIRRGFWFTEGYSPSSVYNNELAQIPFRPATLDQTIEMPEPGKEAAGPRREIPTPRELPDMNDSANRWIYELKMRKILHNGSILTALADDARRDKFFRDISEKGDFNAIMQNGQLSRHTYPPALGAAASRVIADCAKTSHKYGFKYIDHLDVTLLWDVGGGGFRMMMERLDEVQLDIYVNLPCFFFCPDTPKFKKRFFGYLRREVAAGVDGFQLDELGYWHHGCTCAHCREKFHRETGWWMPLDETEGSSFFSSKTPLAQLRREWQMRNITNWRVDLRRHVKDLNSNLFMSAYGIYLYMLKPPTYLPQFEDLSRVMSCLGTEVMPRHPIRQARPLMPLMRVKTVFRKAYGIPAWNWFYPPDAAGCYYCWGLATMVGEAPLVNPSKPDPTIPDFMSWPKRARAMDPIGAKPVAKVGILLSTSSIENGPDDDFVPEAFGLAQTLEALHIPYDFVGEMAREWADVKHYDVVFLAHADCMNDRTKWLIEALIRDGKRVYGRPGCGSRQANGTPRPSPVTGYTEMPSAAPFYAPELNDNGLSKFNPDPAAEAAFRKTVAGFVAGAEWWNPVRIPAGVQTSVMREKSGGIVNHFLNATGDDLKCGEWTVDAKCKTTFPPMTEDLVFELPAETGNRVVAFSPDSEGERELKSESVGEDRRRVTLPKDLLKGYTLVRAERLAKVSLDAGQVLGPVKPVNGVGQQPMWISRISSAISMPTKMTRRTTPSPIRTIF